MSPEQHEEDHAAWRAIEPELRAFLDERKAARERWERVRTNVIGGVILAAIGGVGSFLYWIGCIAIEQASQGKHP